MKLVYRTSIDDLFKYEKKTVKSITIQFSIPISLCVFSCMVYVTHFFDFPRLGYIILLAILPVIYILSTRIIKRIIYNSFKKEFLKTDPNIFESDLSFEVLENFLEEKSPLGETKTPLSHIKEVRENDDFILIDLKYSETLYIPIKGIQNNEDKESFISTLKDKIV
jgi:hypothetical protein